MKTETTVDRALFPIKFTFYFAWFFIDFLRWCDDKKSVEMEQALILAWGSWAILLWGWIPLLCEIFNCQCN